MECKTKKATILLLVSLYTFLFYPIPVIQAQEKTTRVNPDRTAPVIQHAVPTQPIPAGRPLIIEATITDEGGIQGAVLFYRFIGTREYFITEMIPSNNDVYSVTILKQYVQEPGIEYYIQASDKAGNTKVLQGMMSSPLKIKVEGQFSPAKPWYKKWWVWTIASAVVIGAVAASAGGGGGGGGSSGGPSGTAVIDQPIP
jgi:hypothetical protein